MKHLRSNINTKPNRLKRGLCSTFQLFLAVVFFMAQMHAVQAAIDNDARAVGVFNGAVVTAPISSQSIPVVPANPDLAVTKAGVLNDDDGTPGLSAGDTISYTVTVTNPGNVTLTGITINDPLVALNFQSGDLDNDFSLDTNETWIYTGDYTITSFDLATNGGGDGDIDNTVTADSNETPPETASQQTPINPDIAIVVDKSGTLNDDDGVSGVTAGDTIDYVINVENTGVASLTNINVTDNLVQGATNTSLSPIFIGGDANSNDQIDAGEIWTYNLTYTLTPANISNGNDLVNTVSVTTDEIGPREDTDTQVIPGAINSFTMEKIATLVDGDNDGLGDVGEVINYTFRFVNTGNRVLANLAVSDPLPGLSAIVCANDGNGDGSIDSLNPSQTLECSASYTIQGSDASAGTVDNTATPSATQNDGVTPVLENDAPNDNSTSTPVDRVVDLDVAKSGTLNDDDGTLGVSAGDTIDYRVEVTNPGTVPLTNVTVDDPLVTLVFQSGDVNNNDQLDMGEVWLYTGPYTLTVNDITTNGGGDGDIDNTVTADSDQTATESASAEVDISSGASLQVSKTGILNDDDGNTGVTAGDTIDYTITIENDGTNDLTNVSLADTLVQNGNATTLTPLFDAASDLNSDSVLNPGETWVYRITYALTPANLADGNNLVNTVEVTTDQTPPEDASDIQVLAPPLDSFTMTKIASLADGDGDGLADPGEDINYTFRFTNTGTRALTNLSVTDPLPGLTSILCSNDVDGDGDIDFLSVGASLDCVAVYTTQISDIANSSVDNTATTSATAADGVTNVVEDDSANDNSTSTPTDTNISIDVNKSIASAVEILPNVVELEYLLELTNTGSVPLTNLTLTDDLTSAISAPSIILGSGSITLFSGFVGSGTSNSSYNGIGNNEVFAGDVQLAAGATGQVRIQVRIDRRAQTLETENVALVASTQIPTPTPSDNPDDPTGNTDPTPFDRPDLDQDGGPDDNESPVNDRDGDGISDQEDFDPTGYFYCEADGRILTGGNISVVNVFTGGSQSGVGSSNDITILQDGSNGFYQFYVTAPGTYRLVPTLPSGGVASTDRLSSGTLDATSLLPSNPGVLGAGETGSTGILSDFSAGANPFFTEFVINSGDPAIFNNNIPLGLCGSPELTASKSIASEPSVQSDGSHQVTYLMEAENTGTQAIDNVFMQDNLATVFGAGNFTVVNSVIDSAPAGFAATPSNSFNGVNDIDMLTTGGGLEPGESVSILMTLNIDVPTGSFTNELVVGGDDRLTGAPIPELTSFATLAIAVPTANEGDIVATKSTRVDAAPIGGIVPYTITFENVSGSTIDAIDLVDLLPHGFSYVEGSALVDGVALEPSLVDWNLVWTNQTLAPGQQVTITFSLVVGAGITGTEFINTAVARDPLDNSDVSNRATAVIRLEIESVFQCSHIIGRVFDDLDKDGYHDVGEPGLPGVRVVSVNGLLITTDEFGRYHVACDVIPADRIGSNYILKLDDRTLPTGYSVTSENPRVIRVTQGKLSKINFAATRLRKISVELTDSSFNQGTKSLTRSALKDIGKTLPLLEDERSILKLKYETQGEITQFKRKRIESVKALINKAWKSRKRPYKLVIETDVK